MRIHAHRRWAVAQDVFFPVEGHGSGSRVVFNGVDEDERVDTGEVRDQIEAGVPRSATVTRSSKR